MYTEPKFDFNTTKQKFSSKKIQQFRSKTTMHVTYVSNLYEYESLIDTQLNVLGTCFLQQCTPELIGRSGLAEQKVVANSGEPVIHHHFVGPPLDPQTESEDAYILLRGILLIPILKKKSTEFKGLSRNDEKVAFTI